jgi:hypothetical protein
MQSLTLLATNKFSTGQTVVGQINCLRLGGQIVMIVAVPGKEIVYSVMTLVGFTVEFKESEILS